MRRFPAHPAAISPKRKPACNSISEMMWDGWGWGWGWAWMWAFWVFILALIIFAVWRMAANGRHVGPHRDPAEEMLRMRYARGEIDAEEYERRLSDLRRNR